jgi:hypothetical protein
MKKPGIESRAPKHSYGVAVPSHMRINNNRTIILNYCIKITFNDPLPDIIYLLQKVLLVLDPNNTAYFFPVFKENHRGDIPYLVFLCKCLVLFNIYFPHVCVS